MKQKFLVMLMAFGLVLALTSAPQAASFVVSGTYLKVGIDNSGGLVDLSTPQGITYLPVLPGIPNDYTLPGTPWEFYSLKVNGATLTGGVNGAANNPIGLTTVNNSGGTNFKLDSNGPAFTLGGATLGYDQSVSFDKNGKVIKFKADIFNVGTTTATNLYYGRGLDPDQDVGKFGSFVTKNTFPGPGSVLAVGPDSGLFIRIDDLSKFLTGITSISGSSPEFPWAVDPQVLYGGGLVNGALPGNPNDYSINIAWYVASLAPGASVEFDWSYTIGAVPEPATMLLLGTGLLGMGVFVRRRFKK